MSFLLDTNVVSEWTKPRPDVGVVEFLLTEDEDTLFLSIVTLAELRRGVDRLAAGRRRNRLDDWLRNDLLARFTGRLLGIGADGRYLGSFDRTTRAGWPADGCDGWLDCRYRRGPRADIGNTRCC